MLDIFQAVAFFRYHRAYMISLIVAASENDVIGSKNDIPWRLPDDWKNFKAVTMDCPVIMGRKTHDSIGRALPGRRNIVVSRQEGLRIEGCDVVSSVEAAIELAKAENAREIFVIGGEAIFREVLPLAGRVYLTLVHTVIEGDVFFPPLDPGQWAQVSCVSHEADEKHPYGFDMMVLERRK
jgi:dihydrofolate reductase